MPASRVEKQWVRGYVNDVYLWYHEVPQVNPADPLYSVDTIAGFYTSINNYFNALLSPVLTPSGNFKDQFSFTYPTRLWSEQINSGVGRRLGHRVALRHLHHHSHRWREDRLRARRFAGRQRRLAAR